MSGDERAGLPPVGSCPGNETVVDPSAEGLRPGPHVILKTARCKSPRALKTSRPGSEQGQTEQTPTVLLVFPGNHGGRPLLCAPDGALVSNSRLGAFMNTWKQKRKQRRPSPLEKARARRDAARAIVLAEAENHDRIAAIAGPILIEAGYPCGTWVPDSLATDLMLAGRDMDARWVTSFLRSRGALWRADQAERAASAAYERLLRPKATTVTPGPPNGSKPPWDA